ncbi:voltage-dependent calcium channel subunit alpha-2/delta-3-like isoform X2 [Montipora foliosa]|uniref:voltage-dependent calcium channel subunit alpha-2/delta-3-like isoform X2 n=1 Tax=Montipora foliosa TaxID=591990 RepID=UPI0035F17634
MPVHLTWVLFFLGAFCALARTGGAFGIKEVEEWAKDAGEKLRDFFNRTTKFNELQEEYKRSRLQLSVSKKDGSQIVRDMTIHLEGILQSKTKSIKHLAEKTAEVRENYTFNPSLKDVEYLNTKKLPEDYFRTDRKFSYSVAINKNNSVVHIPTDVYSGGIKIQNTITWTKKLNPYFKENDRDDPSLLWQYFGSSDGVYRVYPGFKWQDPSENDVFDNRRRGWYIQGSSSPKDIVLLLDLSGSMAGQKLAIVKLAAMSLLETLQENDFVNIVVVYSNDDNENENVVVPYMVCQVKDKASKDEKNLMKEKRTEVANCSDHLLQATQQNKKYLKYFVPKLKARGVAAISVGFEFAINNLLKKSNQIGHATSSGCTQAIILFTDGIEEKQAQTTLDLLRKMNAEKKIRVFTYLVGREKSSTDQPLKKISSDYKGCSFRIQTLSDVREKVLEYVKVLSRPLGFDGDPDPSWTPIYLDKLGLGLMITLVAPVFNKSSQTDYKGELLGVVGTDVALPQLEGSVPGSEVGVDGYGFAINNNGFVLFHPGLDKEKDPPNIALDELEFNSSEAKQLMREMINRTTGNKTFKSRVIYNHKHRISRSEEYHYFYSPINNTSFSAAVAIPESSMFSLSIDVPRDLIRDLTLLESSRNNEFVIVAPWKICPNTTIAAINDTPVYQPAYPTAQDIINDDNLEGNCDLAKLRYLFFDAKITQDHANKWNASDSKHEEIDSVFVATQGGIMRWLNLSPLSSPLGRDYIKEEFYTKAAQFAEEQIVFSARYRAADYKAEVNTSVSINASSPVFVVINNQSYLAAVVGMQVSASKINETIFNKTDGCSDSSECCVRVIDDDGFIVATNQDESEVGKSFAHVENCVMKEFLNNSFYEGLTFTSVQEECKKSSNAGDSSSARRLLNPLFAVTAYVQFWTQTLFWSLAQLNVYSFFSRRGVALAEEEENSGPEMIPCSKELDFYKAVLKNTSYHGDLLCSGTDPGTDSWRVYMAPINGTNLRLVVVKGSHTCGCKSNHSQSGGQSHGSQNGRPEPVDEYDRRRPEFPCHDKGQDEGKPPCALASLTSPHFIIVIFLLILALCL